MNALKKTARILTTTFICAVALSLTWYGLNRTASGSQALQTFEITSIEEQEVKSAPLRVGAYNIAHGRGGKLGESNWTSTTREQGQAHLQQVVEQIKASELDVLVLNEVDFDANWSGGYDQARFIAERAGFRFVAELTNIDINLPFFDLAFGNAILSKVPLKNIAAIELPPVKWWEPILAGKKNAVEATIDWKGKPLSFVAIHIETRSRETRLGSVEVLVERIQNTNTPYILLGDFNSQKTRTAESAIDILLEKHGYKTDVSFEKWKTFPSESPDRGIDWILIDDRLKIQNTLAIPSTLSDHLMITAEITQ